MLFAIFKIVVCTQVSVIYDGDDN